MKKRTKAAYLRLFDHPDMLFPASASGEAVEVILFPNGAHEIWIRDRAGNGFRISAGRGPAGIALRIGRFTLGGELTVSGNVGPRYEKVSLDRLRAIEICQYERDDWAQAFKAWYLGDSDDPNRPEYPGPRATFYERRSNRAKEQNESQTEEQT